MNVIKRSLVLDKDTTFDDDLMVIGQIIGPKHTLTVKGSLICIASGNRGTIIVKNLDVSEVVHSGAVIARRASASEFFGETLVAREINGKTDGMAYIEKVDECL